MRCTNGIGVMLKLLIAKSPKDNLGKFGNAFILAIDRRPAYSQPNSGQECRDKTVERFLPVVPKFTRANCDGAVPAQIRRLVGNISCATVNFSLCSRTRSENLIPFVLSHDDTTPFYQLTHGLVKCIIKRIDQISLSK